MEVIAFNDKMDIDKQRQIVHLTRQQRLPIPDEILNAPKILRQNSWYYKAFTRLNSERSTGMGMGPIPWSKIIKYAEFNKLDEDETWFLEYVITRLDVEYCKLANKDGNA